ncbi:MAG: hypothetical protein WCB86_09900, partial [Candidatus Dormiibacterota bacterium]
MERVPLAEAVRRSVELRLTDPPQHDRTRPTFSRSGIPIRDWLPTKYGFHFVAAHLVGELAPPTLAVQFSWRRSR